MNDVLLTAILGAGAGAAYGILAVGVVVIHRGSGVVNFAHGAIATFAAFCFVPLVENGMSKYLAALLVILGAALAGVLIYALIMRPLRRAPVLSRVVATLGLLAAVPAAVVLIWGTDVGFAPSLFPTSRVELLGGGFGSDRLYIVGLTLLTAVALWALYRFTAFGLMTRAAAENEKGAALLGYSPDVIAGTNWALGCALAALAGIVIAPLSGLDPGVMPLLILPALAAALVARFTSFGIAVTVGLLIGVVQSEITSYWQQPGATVAVPFVAVIIAMIAMGKRLPTRGTLAEGRPPVALSGRVPLVAVVLFAVAFIVLAATASRPYVTGLSVSMITAVAALSVVVITGYVGQISLMQLTFAGVGGFLAAKLATGIGIPFPISILAAALLTAPIGVLLGLPALRVRGTQLAVLTLGAAITIDAVVFQNQSWTGGFNGQKVPEPLIWGFSLDPFQHPTRFALFSLLVLGLTALLVSNLRRSPLGRRMLAVRGNERAAAAMGISVAGTKLQAFALSAFIAAISGGVLGYSLGNISFAQFVPLQSVTLVTIVYIGGIAAISGAIVAGAIASGGIVFVLLSDIGAVGEYYALVAGIAVIWTVITQPDGGVVLARDAWEQLGQRLRRQRIRPDVAGVAPPETG